jgi:hypothetical protein
VPNEPLALRDIVESALFSAALAQLRVDRRRLDDALEAAIWVIARDAEGQSLIEGTTLRVVLTNSLRGVPPLRIIFTIDDDTRCILHHIGVRRVASEIEPS